MRAFIHYETSSSSPGLLADDKTMGIAAAYNNWVVGRNRA